MFDPQEVYSAMAQQWGQHTLLLMLHKQWHEMVNLRHGHITFVVSANQGLRVRRKDSAITSIQTQGSGALGCHILFSPTFLLSHIHLVSIFFFGGDGEIIPHIAQASLVTEGDCEVLVLLLPPS